MTINEAARELRNKLDAPHWALSVAAVRENGQDALLVRVDPNYHRPLDVPKTFHQYVVRIEWRRPIHAGITE
jgi:hypothetical protein